MNAWRTKYYHLNQSSFLFLEKLLSHPKILHKLRNYWNNEQYDKIQVQSTLNTFIIPIILSTWSPFRL